MIRTSSDGNNGGWNFWCRLDLLSQPWQTLYQAAEFAIAQEHWLAAEPLLVQVLEQIPSHSAAHHLLGKVFRQQQRVEEALQAQQRSCALDPALGWNWFSAGELLLELNRWEEAAIAFENAIAVLPAEGWITDHLASARWLLQCNGENLADGVCLQTYKYWIDHYETRLPSESAVLNTPFWFLETFGQGQQRWRALHNHSSLQPLEAPLGHSPWPTDGWLVLLGEGALLRDGALQAIESWLAGVLPEQRSVRYFSQLNPLTRVPLLQPDMIYPDEDKINGSGQRCDPWFKPGWVEESFWSSPWITTLSFWRISWLRERLLPLPPSDVEDRWRWQLSALKKCPQIQHIPLVLAHAGPTQKLSPEPLKQHLQERGEKIQVTQAHPAIPGCFQLQWELPKRWSCTVIIPTRDRADLLERCLNRLWSTTSQARSNGLDLEVIVVDNGSLELATLKLFQAWQKKIRILRCDEAFNWSRLNNFAAAQSKGELLLLLNNDIEAYESGWIEAMAAQAFRPVIGAVGAILLYPEGTIQHGGVIVGMPSGTDHAYRNLKLDHNVHRGRSRLLTGWGAVTGACLMLRKELLETVGGFDEALPVEFNDVDLCLRLTQLGYRCVIPGKAVLIHYESQSRDSTNSHTAAQALRKIQNRWKARLATAEPWWPAQSDLSCFDGRPFGMNKAPI